MLIQYVTTGGKREVADGIGRRLVRSKIARLVQPKVEPLIAKVVEPEPDPVVEAVDEVEISPRTGKPKRQYKRRDMQAED